MTDPVIPKPELLVESGVIIAHRLFDICYSIDLSKVEVLWTQRSGKATSRSKLSKTPEKAVAFDVPPVLLSLDGIDLGVGEKTVHASVTARIYDFGVIVLILQIPAEHVTYTEFTSLLNAVDRAVGPAAATDLWDGLRRTMCTSLAPALTRTTSSLLQEDYLTAVVRQWSEPVHATELLERVDLVPLLSGEQRPLSEGTRRDLLRQRFSYYEDDLVVLTWDRAFIFEPRGDSDVCDILEIANAQLLELRYYDELLDDELPRMYSLVKETRRTLSPRRFANLARTLYTLVAEVTELTERVDNALQVTEDVYLARVYLAALETFRVPPVGAAVDRKLSIVRDTYSALFDEASGARGVFLEVTVVILIVIEIVVALLYH